MFKVHLLNHAK